MTLEYYDSSLNHILPSNNGNDPIVMNEYFSQWGEHIRKTLRTIDCDGGGKYINEQSKELLEACLEHARQYSMEIEADNVLLVTHPFYTRLCHMKKIDTPERKKVLDDYTNKIMYVFGRNISSENLNVVPLEIVHHYAAATSLLMEEHLIDNVVFTRFDQGIILNKSDLDVFKDKNIFMGGGYNGRCLKYSIGDVEHYVGKKRVKVVQDIVLNPPATIIRQPMKRKRYYGKFLSRVKKMIPKHRLTTLDSLIKDLDGKEFSETL